MGKREMAVHPGNRDSSYHSWKANVITDALNRKSLGVVLPIVEIQHPIQMDSERLDVELMEGNQQTFIANLAGEEVSISDDGALRFRSRLFVLADTEIRRMILEEAHKLLYTVHLGSMKMYRNLRESFWWSDKKSEIAEFVKQCLTCEQIKVEHQSTKDQHGKDKTLYG
ncbi:uncharacterized protein LOC131155888 [Malania oleifera]|uniref:uncharacterized protein LOC131155888 n=1 Tax=Malania oleifera TaxID=397392 RepID=UPI0025ADFBC6|nr:uncharacterized protein LOC131155888 [Malania oleifera]